MRKAAIASSVWGFRAGAALDGHAAYFKVLALLVPREQKVEHRNPLKELTDEELEAMIEHLKASIEAQAQRVGRV